MSLPLCKDCVNGDLNAGTPTGHVETIHGHPSYVAEPEGDPKGIVVIISDAFGWEFVNNRILADTYAKGGFRVLLPEFMEGHAMSPDALSLMLTFEDKSLWFYQKIPAVMQMIPQMAGILWYNGPAAAQPRIEKFFLALRASTSLPIGAAGFCWGGKFTTQLCSGTNSIDKSVKPLVDCGFIAHPSRLAIPEEIGAVRMPLSFAHAETDFMVPPAAANTAKEILDRKKAAGEVDTEFVLYKGARHGFAVRNHGKEEATFAADAEKQAVAWFTKHLTNKK